jgi:hypothetical protein
MSPSGEKSRRRRAARSSDGLAVQPRRRASRSESGGQSRKDLARPRKAERRGRANDPRVNTTGRELACLHH